MQRIMEEVQFWQIWLEGVCGRWIKTTKTDLFKDWSIFRERRYKDCWAEKHRRPCMSFKMHENRLKNREPLIVFLKEEYFGNCRR